MTVRNSIEKWKDQEFLSKWLESNIEDEKIKTLLSKMIIYKALYQNIENDNVFVLVLGLLIDKKMDQFLDVDQELKSINDDRIVFNPKWDLKKDNQWKLILDEQKIQNWVSNKVKNQELWIKKDIKYKSKRYILWNARTSSLARDLSTYYDRGDYVCLSTIKRKDPDKKYMDQIKNILQNFYYENEANFLQYIDSLDDEIDSLDQKVTKKLMKVLKLNK